MQVTVPRPDVKGRTEILNWYLSKIKVDTGKSQSKIFQMILHLLAVETLLKALCCLSNTDHLFIKKAFSTVFFYSCGSRDHRPRHSGLLWCGAGEPGQPGSPEGGRGRERDGHNEGSGVRQGQDPHGWVHAAFRSALRPSRHMRRISSTHCGWERGRMLTRDNMNDFIVSFYKPGPERRSVEIDKKNKTITAYHESGHAIVAYFTKDAMPINKATIMPRGPTLGHVSCLYLWLYMNLTESAQCFIN